MTDDEAHIRTLIERWADAVHAGDLDGVFADHATDIVMFDVPPPNDGVRGIDAYRATWPPFFDWQRGRLTCQRRPPASMTAFSPYAVDSADSGSEMSSMSCLHP
jgi:ketosteroid isomerase-like protein